MRVRILCSAVSMAIVGGLVHGGTLKKYFSKEEGEGKISLEGNQNVDSTVPSQEGEKPKVAELALEKPAADVSDQSAHPPVSTDSGSTEPRSAPKGPDGKTIVGDPVVLRINGKEFRRSQILADMQNIPPQYVQGMSSEQLFKILVEQKLNSHLLVEQGKKARVVDRREFIDRLEGLRDSLIAEVYVMMEIGPKTENEASLRARYTRYLVEFKKGKEFRVRHIMVASEEAAKGVLSALDKGESFEKLAKEKSLAPSKDKGGDEGYVPVDAMPPQLKDKIILLKEREWTKDALELGGSWHLFYVENIRETTPQKYDEAVPMLKRMVMQEEMAKLIERLQKVAKIERYNEDGTKMTVPPPPAGRPN
ncbi:MAG: peptidylprolyl isomerase [Holosporaceae bacterium]|nr:peptidylprolyl isomerase [Holosporaceae bacterium]